MRIRALIGTSLLGFGACVALLSGCLGPGRGGSVAGMSPGDGGVAVALGTQARYDLVMTSRFCGTCHPAIYAEHAQNTHGRAYTDPEVRLATGHFDTGDCIRCHTPRPIFETGNGMNPQTRHFGLEEGNSCMTCHWRPSVDYSQFVGGPDCKSDFDPRVGEVEACAACHKNHGTPYQWADSPNGKEAGRTCVACHMKQVERPVATGGPVRLVRSHVFPGARSVEHVASAYDYRAVIEGNEAVVVIDNTGAGHNFPTELRQRSLESLIVVRDVDGREVARSRRVFRDPYRRPYGMTLPTNKQIPSGEHREHRMPVSIADGTVECELHYKYYFPIEDNHPDLARRLERQVLPFHGIEPNAAPVVTDGEAVSETPEGIDARLASPGDLGEISNTKAGTVEFVIPTGDTAQDIADLVALFNFQMPEANRKATDRLVAIGLPAVPALIEALGSWDNKTFNSSMKVLRRIGDGAVPAVRAALRHDSLYVRLHARALLAELPVPLDRGAFVGEVLAGLGLPNAMDRTTSSELLGRLYAREAVPELRRLLGEFDADVVRAAAFALAEIGDRESVDAIAAAMARIAFAETRIDLAWALARLGSTVGIPVLLEQLDHRDDLIRETCFEHFYSVTGQHKGFDPYMPPDERLAAISRLWQWWSRDGASFTPLRPHLPDPGTDRHAFHIVEMMGGGGGLVPAAANEDKAADELVGLGRDAVPALIRGLKFPPGFATKRAAILATLGRIGDASAAPFVAAALRDPVYGVAHWAASALASCGDADCLPALWRFDARVRRAIAAGQLPPGSAAGDAILATAAGTRLQLGDDTAKSDLVGLLVSQDLMARRIAIAALTGKFGDARGYEASAEAADRRAAVARWLE